MKIEIQPYCISVNDAELRVVESFARTLGEGWTLRVIATQLTTQEMNSPSLTPAVVWFLSFFVACSVSRLTASVNAKEATFSDTKGEGMKLRLLAVIRDLADGTAWMRN